jgi:RNA methyltransferase, TrmH family
LASPLEVRTVFLGEELAPADASWLEGAAARRGVDVRQLATGVAARVADTVTPQAAFAVAARPHHTLDELARAGATGAGPVVVLVDVADPGNTGTLVRTAEAAGAVGVVCAGDTADPFGPKGVRAAAGAAFRLPIAEVDEPVDALAVLQAAGVVVYATVVGDGAPYDAVDLTGPVALVLGNEASGLDPAVVTLADARVTVPMHGPTESLNVAATGAVLCFEAARQRRRRIGRPDGDGTGLPPP